MKYALVGDFHGADLEGLERKLKLENPDVLICTGDFDQTKTIYQFMALESKYPTLKVPGNHDHAILTNLPVYSSALEMQGKTSEQLHNELRGSAAERYIRDLVDPNYYRNNRIKLNLDEEKFGEKYPTMIIHGALDGDSRSYPDCPSELRDLWLRLRTEEDYKLNFEAMDKEGVKVMIRGHDHEPQYTYKDDVKGIKSYDPRNDGAFYRLFGHRKHVINPGALYKGDLAIIDTNYPEEDVPVLRYLKI